MFSSSFSKGDRSWYIGINPQEFNRFKLMKQYQCLGKEETLEDKKDDGIIISTTTTTTTDNVSSSSSSSSSSSKTIQLQCMGGKQYLSYEFTSAGHFYQFLDQIKSIGLLAVDEYLESDSKENKNKDNNTSAVQEGVIVGTGGETAGATSSSSSSSNTKEGIGEKIHGVIINHYDDLVENVRYHGISYCYFDRWSTIDNKELEDFRFSIHKKGPIIKPTENSKTIGLRYGSGQWLQLVFRYAWELPEFLTSIQALGLAEAIHKENTEEEQEQNINSITDRFEKLQEKDYHIVLNTNVDGLYTWYSDREHWVNARAAKEKAASKPSRKSKSGWFGSST